MVIQINHKKVIGKAIEWSDKVRSDPIAFIIKCPFCSEKQLVFKKSLYVGVNNSKNNHRCKICGEGIKKKRMWGDSKPKIPFEPRLPGWRSL